MSRMTDDLRTEARKALEQLTTLRDEVRLKLHLASMDAKQAWKDDLEPQIEEAEKMAGEVTEASRQALHDLVEKARAFADEHFKSTKP